MRLFGSGSGVGFSGGTMEPDFPPHPLIVMLRHTITTNFKTLVFNDKVRRSFLSVIRYG
jgi:hypothetical protein